MWIIQDWTGARKFPDREFPTFDAGIEFIQTQFDDVADREEFYVVPRSGPDGN